MTERVGIGELQAHLNDYVDRAAVGEEIVITRQGKAICRLVPRGPEAPTAPQPYDGRLWALVQAGKASWSGKRLRPAKPVTMRSGPGIADLIREEREGREDRILDAIYQNDAVPRQ